MRTPDLEDPTKTYQARLRALSVKLSDAREIERKQLSQELHDHVGFELGLARLKLSEVVRGREKEIPDEVKDLLFGVEDHLKQAIRQTRNIGYEYCPQVLYDVGLLAALQWLADYYSDKTGLNITFSSNPEAEVVLLPAKLRPRLFVAMRELLYNAYKYAKPDSINLSLQVDSDQILTLQVEDDGLGFDLEILEHMDLISGGFGLFSIREMTEHLGGTFVCQSSPGSGTTVQLIFPFLLTPISK